MWGIFFYHLQSLDEEAAAQNAYGNQFKITVLVNARWSQTQSDSKYMPSFTTYDIYARQQEKYDEWFSLIYMGMCI